MKLALWLSIPFVLIATLAGCRQWAADEPSNAVSGVELTAMAEGIEGTPATSASTIVTLGVIRPVQQMALSFRNAGVLESIHVQIGSPVHKGELIAQLDSTELDLALQDAQAVVEMRQAEVELLLSNAQSNQPQRVIAEAQLRQAQFEVERLQWQLQGASIRAPFNGLIAELSTDPGEWVISGTPIVELIDTSIWLVETKNVSELEIGRVHIGQRATVDIIPFAGQRIAGEVMSISPIAIVQQGDTTYTLYIRLAQSDLPLLPGMNAEVEIETAASSIPVSTPERADPGN